MTHVGYVVSAYLATALVLALMAAWTALDLQRQRRRLARLEAAGLRRRPEGVR